MFLSSQVALHLFLIPLHLHNDAARDVSGAVMTRDMPLHRRLRVLALEVIAPVFAYGVATNEASDAAN